jgi:AraC-like DNA-binding protein
MNDTLHSLQLFSLPGHSCRATKAGWTGRNVALKLRQGIVVNIVKVTITEDQANVYASSPPGSDLIAACIVLKGQLQIKLPNEKEATLEPQKFSLFPAQSLNFRMTAPKQEKLYVLTYSFPRKILTWSIKGSGSHVSSCFGSDDPSRCRYMGIPVNREIHRSVAEIMGSRLTGQLQKLYLEGAILQTLAHKIDQLEKLPPESDLLPPKSEEDRLRDAHEDLLNNLIKPPTIKQLATKCGMTERRFSTSFRALYGTSINDALLTKRMALAMEKLEEGKLPMIKIARSVGYRHVSNFISAFTRHYGMPPRAYMRQTRS